VAEDLNVSRGLYEKQKLRHGKFGVVVLLGAAVNHSISRPRCKDLNAAVVYYGPIPIRSIRRQYICA